MIDASRHVIGVSSFVILGVMYLCLWGGIGFVLLVGMGVDWLIYGRRKK